MFHEDADEPLDGTAPVSSKPDRWTTPERYLEAERRAPHRSEYLDGQVFALAGASLEHNLVVGNLVAGLNVQLKGGPCCVFPSDMRLRVTATGLYTYPDVTVVCGEPELQDEHRDVLLNPAVIFEVLSESTEAYDRGRKAAHYRAIPSLREYFLVAQDEPRIERYRRQGPGEWVFSETRGLDEQVEFVPVACVLSLRDVYDRLF